MLLMNISSFPLEVEGSIEGATMENLQKTSSRRFLSESGHDTNENIVCLLFHNNFVINEIQTIATRVDNLIDRSESEQFGVVQNIKENVFLSLN